MGCSRTGPAAALYILTIRAARNHSPERLALHACAGLKACATSNGPASAFAVSRLRQTRKPDTTGKARRYQDIIDGFIQGESVTEAVLREVLLNSSYETEGNSRP